MLKVLPPEILSLLCPWWRMKNSVPLVLGDNEEPGVGTWEVRDTLAPQGRSEWAAGLVENSWPLERNMDCNLSRGVTLG